MKCLDLRDRIFFHAFLNRHGFNYPTLLVTLGGDSVVHSLGYEPLGLSLNAGLALALAEATTHNSSQSKSNNPRFARGFCLLSTIRY